MTEEKAQVEQLEEIKAVHPSDEKIFVATQWQLMWWRLRRHKPALISGVIVIIFYLVALFCEFVAPYTTEMREIRLLYAPVQSVHFFREGKLSRPFVYGSTRVQNPTTLQFTYQEDTSKWWPLVFFAKGTPYKLWNLIDTDRHLVLAEGEGATISLLGRDRLGRDMFTRVVYGARISMSIGLVGVLLSLTLGILLGGLSGYYGGFVDIAIQRVIEFLSSMPTIPLWMGLAAAVPDNWDPVRVYFAITVIISLISWTGMARVVRGRFLTLREEDFVMSARLVGSSEMRIILRHMVPSFMSHIIASVSLSIPHMILSETSLSFLGLGLKPPAVSWGVLLQEAQNVRSVALAPWLLLPGLAVVIIVLAFNFMGDGIRDAADPYGR